jgi:hypothetical protein
MRKRQEQIGGPEGSSPFHELLPQGAANPQLGEARPMHLHRLDDEPLRLRYAYPESFFYGPPAGAGERRWTSSVVAATLSLTLVASMIALALVGGRLTPGSVAVGSGRLPSELEGPAVQVPPGTAAEEQAAGQNTASAVTAGAAAPSAVTAAAPPAPSVETTETTGGEGFGQGGESGSGGAGEGGITEGGGTEGGGLVGGEGTTTDADGVPTPPTAGLTEDSDTDKGNEEGDDQDDVGFVEAAAGIDMDDGDEVDPGVEGEVDQDEGDEVDPGVEDSVDQRQGDDEESDEEDENSPVTEAQLPPAVQCGKDKDVEEEPED